MFILSRLGLHHNLIFSLTRHRIDQFIIAALEERHLLACQEVLHGILVASFLRRKAVRILRIHPVLGLLRRHFLQIISEEIPHEDIALFKRILEYDL